MRHFLTTENWSRVGLQNLLNQAGLFKESPFSDDLKGKTVALLFFNPSLRTRCSFDVGVYQMGGKATPLQSGTETWPLEFEIGATMDGLAEEHVSEAAKVLSCYFDLIGIRAFPKFQNWEEDKQDKIIQSFAKFSCVPVFNMETIVHPCQELALMKSIQDNVGSSQNKKMLVTWVPHPKPLNTAVANSACLISSKFGMDVTLLCPNENFILDDRFINAAKVNAKSEGGSFRVSHDIKEAYDGVDMVYAKSWGALPYFGNWDAEKPIREKYKNFIVNEEKMALTNGAYFSHCLPMRRNVKATDAIADSPKSLIIEEAENRLYVQKAMMKELLKGGEK